MEHLLQASLLDNQKIHWNKQSYLKKKFCFYHGHYHPRATSSVTADLYNTPLLSSSHNRITFLRLLPEGRDQEGTLNKETGFTSKNKKQKNKRIKNNKTKQTKKTYSLYSLVIGGTRDNLPNWDIGKIFFNLKSEKKNKKIKKVS